MNESPSLNTETRLPRQVRERAERARAALEPQSETPEAPPPQAAAAPPPPPAADPPKEPPPSPPADPRESDAGYWKQRFMSVDGLWRQDRIRFKEQLRLRDEQIVGLQAEADKLKSQGAANGTVKLEDHFSSDELESMDESARNAAIAAITASHRATRSELEKVRATARKSNEDRAKERAEETQRAFLSKLTELIPDWPTINASDGWKNWLGELNDDGEERNDVLMAAQSSGNAIKAAKIFKEYLQLSAPPPPPPPPPPPIMPKADVAGGGPSDSNPTPAEKPPTTAEIRDFYKRAAIGKISKEERTAFEARLNAHYGGSRG